MPDSFLNLTDKSSQNGKISLISSIQLQFLRLTVSITNPENVSNENQVFDKINYAESSLTGKQFTDCTFTNCDFSNYNMACNTFVDCIFDGCNLAMIKRNSTTLNNVVFKNCKILGVNFSEAIDFLFNVTFEVSVLDYASFARKKMLKTRFHKSSLKEVSFTQANLCGSLFDDCDHLGAIFNKSDLTATNFSTSYNLIIDPKLNNIKKAIFSAEVVMGLLAKYQIKVV